MRGAGSKPILAESVPDSICRRSRVRLRVLSTDRVWHPPGYSAPGCSTWSKAWVSRGSNDGGTPDPIVLYGQDTRRHSLVSGWGTGPDLVERRGHVSDARRCIAVEGF